MVGDEQPESRTGYQFESFDEVQEALLNLVRWPENDGRGMEWKVRCRKVETGRDPKRGRYVCLTGMGGNMRYYVYEDLPLDKQDILDQKFSWEHFKDASVLLELLVTESATIFGGSMELIMKWLRKHAGSIIEETRYRP